MACNEMIRQAIAYCLKRASWLVVIALIGFVTESFAVEPNPTTWYLCSTSSDRPSGFNQNYTGYTSVTQACAARDKSPAGTPTFRTSACGGSSLVQHTTCTPRGDFTIHAQRSVTPPANATCSTNGCTCNAGYTDTGTACIESACPAGSVRKTVGSDTQCYPILTCPNEFHVFNPDADTTKCTFQGCDLALYTYAVTSPTDSTPACKPRKQCASNAIFESSPNLSEPATCKCPSPLVHDDLAVACVNPPNGGGTNPPNGGGDGSGSGSTTNPPIGGGAAVPNPPAGTTTTPAVNTGGTSGTTYANGSSPLPNGGGGELPPDMTPDVNNPNNNNVQFDSIPLGGNIATMNVGGDFNINPFGGAGFCPTISSFSVAGRSFSLNIQPLCDFASAMKVVVILIASIAAAFIVTGRSQND